MKTFACPTRTLGLPGTLQAAISQEGFTLAEFMLSTLILLVIAGSVFSLMGRTQRTASYQTEVQAVLENTRIAMETVERIIQQAGNDPLGTGLQGVTITSATEVNIRSDFTGSAGPGSPDQGDSDGDTSDSGENVTIRYNAGNRTLETVAGGSVQPVASNISAFSMQYFDKTGAVTNLGSEVRRVQITLTGTSPLADPQTGQVFSLQQTGDVKIQTRH